MKHFKKPDGSLWAFESDGSQDRLITPDMVPVSDAVLAQMRGPTQAALIAETQDLARQMRLPIIGILDGMQSSALTDGDLPRAKAIEAAKTGLKNITKVDLSGCSTADEMRAVMLAAYKAVAGAAPVEVQTAFAQVLA